MMKMFEDDTTIRTLTYYVDPKYTIRITRPYKPVSRARYQGFVTTIGAPNYLARAFIKQAVKAKEPFPIKKIQVKFYPKKKKK